MLGFRARGEPCMRKILLAALILCSGPSRPGRRVPIAFCARVTVGGEGGFDYIIADSAGRRLYIARSGKTNPRLLAFDLDSLKQVGELDGISAHGAVVDPANRITALPAASRITMFDSTHHDRAEKHRGGRQSRWPVAGCGGAPGLCAEPQRAQHHRDQHRRRLDRGHGRSGRRGRRRRKATARAISMSSWKTRTRSAWWTPRP